MNVCVKAGCTAKVKANGLCNKHYGRDWLAKNPDRAKKYHARPKTIKKAGPCIDCEYVGESAWYGKRCRTCFNKSYWNSLPPARKLAQSAKNKEYAVTLKGRFTRLKAKSKWRRIPVSLTYDEFVALVARSCHYCGQGVLSELGYGVDRLDSNEPYSADNCVPCCPVCNAMKSNLPVDMFLSHIKRIYEMQLQESA